MSYLPVNYEDSRETEIIQRAMEPELRKLWGARDDLLKQLDPNTATWGLAYWEEALGLAVDETKAEDVRRGKIAARLRGMGTTTVERLMDVVTGFLPDSQVSITEVYGEYRVEINFVAPNTLPKGVDDLEEVLDVIMPAHLQWMYVIRITSPVCVGGRHDCCMVTNLPVLEE